MTRSTTFFRSTDFIISRAGTFSRKEAILWRGTLKELRSKLATMCCYRYFSRNLAKIYRTAILTNFFLCMQSKSQWSTRQVLFLNSLMLVVTKRHTYLNKPESFSRRICMNELLLPPGIKGLKGVKEIFKE